MSMTPMKEDGNQADVERLLALAGPRDAVPAERLDRMREAVHQAWTAEGNADTRPGARRLLLWTFGTAAAAAIVFMVVRTQPGASPAEAPVVAAAIHITTGPEERTSRLLPGGGELRVDASSVVTIAGNGEIHIIKGALYLDSKGTTLPPVITPAGSITDIGTRFEVRLVSGNTRVRVRDGKVRLAQASDVIEVAAAEELTARAGESNASIESMTRRHVNPFGAEWEWVARAAPRFDVEGKSLASFLDWIETEGGWTVTFASPAIERSARSTVLHGSVEGMSTTEALEAILLSSGLVHRVDLKTGRVNVSSESTGEGGR
jgi:ferric-dicitrate binding protein FerR (iron transport regulator)